MKRSRFTNTVISPKQTTYYLVPDILCLHVVNKIYIYTI